MHHDFAFASATHLAGLIRERKVSAEELLDLFLVRTARFNPQINANCNNLLAGEVIMSFHFPSNSSLTRHLFQLLCLGISGQDCNAVHIVAPGDTCDSIASSSGTTLSTLLLNNPNINTACSNLGVGEVRSTLIGEFSYPIHTQRHDRYSVPLTQLLTTLRNRCYVDTNAVIDSPHWRHITILADARARDVGPILLGYVQYHWMIG